MTQSAVREITDVYCGYLGSEDVTKACQAKVDELLKRFESILVTDETPLAFCQRYRLCDSGTGLMVTSQSVCDRLKYAYEHTVCCVRIKLAVY